MFRCGRLLFYGYVTFRNVICFIVSCCLAYFFFHHVHIWNVPRQAELNSQLPTNINFNPKSTFVTFTTPDTSHTKTNKVTSNKTILLWTKFFGQQYWITDSVFSECEVPKCKVSLDKLDLESADAVAFHPRDIQSNDWPAKRLQHQRWIHFSMEPPYYNGLNYNTYAKVFNWTMMMRRDSDFPLSYSGIVDKKVSLLTEKSELWKNRTRIINSKSRLVAARISNCQSTHRLQYIKELQKHIPVDVYGKCGTFPCNNACINELKMYKFYLSFENGFCRNYITEKFWMPFLQFDSVPVVMGGAHVDDYKQISPPHSYINVADFNSPEELANYLILLDASPLLYSDFFKWQLSYVIVPVVPTWSQIFAPGLNTAVHRKSPWCQVCRSLHEPSLAWQHYHDLAGWIKEDTCMMSPGDEHQTYKSICLPVVIIFLPLWFLCFVLLRVIIKYYRALH